MRGPSLTPGEGDAIPRRRRQRHRSRVWVLRPPNTKFYVARWRDADGFIRQRTTGATRKRDAVAEAGAIARAVEVEATPDGYLWASFCSRYATDRLAGKRRKTRASWETVANAVSRVLDPFELADLTTARLSAFAAQLRADGLAETSIASYLRTIRAALNWAAEIGLIASAPRVIVPRVPRRKMAKGRPLTGEEFDRVLAAIDKPAAKIAPENRESWRDLVRGLWLSGLRLGEALALDWDRDDVLHVHEVDSRRPMLRVVAEGEKGGRDRLLPITPDFVAFLRNVPPASRIGPVFAPGVRGGTTRNISTVSRKIANLGRLAGVRVAGTPDRPKFATAHDLRRSFGSRWASLVMPAVLRELMRHESIETTMIFYVQQNAERTAEAVYSAYKQGVE